jgi:hypothetical protein
MENSLMDTRFPNAFAIAALAWLAGVPKLAFAQEVAVEVRILKVSDSVMDRLYPNRCTGEQPIVCKECLVGQICKSPGECNAVAFPDGKIVTAAEARLFIETAQGDATTNVMQAPKLTVDSGQTAALDITDERHFVTGIQTIKNGQETRSVPKSETVTTGLQMSVQPIVSADHRFVQLSFHAKLSQLDAVVPMFPVTTFITPVLEDGTVGKPVPFTQYLQQPHVSTMCLDSKMTVPDGCSILLPHGGKVSKETRQENPPEALSKIPYVNRLFKNSPYLRESESMVVLVTPRILAHAEEAKPPTSAVVETYVMPPPPPGPGLVGSPFNVEVIQTGAKIAPPAVFVSGLGPVPVRIVFDPAEKEKPAACQGEGNACCEVARLVELYCRACSEGRLADASQHAIQALAIDPTCFSKCPKACAAGK